MTYNLYHDFAFFATKAYNEIILRKLQLKRTGEAMNIAVITAAGVGARMQNEVPKQFLNVYDKPVVIYTLQAFQNHPNIDAIVVACLDGWQATLQAYCKQFNISKLQSIVTGGTTGKESIYNCLQDISARYGEENFVLVHDAIRPLVSEEIISDSIRSCTLHGSGIAAIPCNEVILYTEDGSASPKAVPRDQLRRTQTPQAFPLGKLLWAHRESEKRNIQGTAASCDLMTALGETVYFSIGSEKNLKLTTMDDIEIFKALLNMDARKGRPGDV